MRTTHTTPLTRSATKNIAIAIQNMNWLAFLLPCLIFSIYGFKNLDLPGLYMDSVNPDYTAAWLQRQSVSIPAWIYPDNWLAGMYEFPLLNSLYGGNSTAYLATIFFKLFGFGAVEVHLFHSLLGISLLLSMTWCLLKWKASTFAVVLFGCALASDPSYIFSWRTQYYLQLYPLIWLFLGLGLIGSILLNGNKNRKKILELKIILAGICIGFSAYSYFIFAIYAGSIAILFYLATQKDGTKPFFQLIAGMLIGFSPYLYAHASIVLNTDFASYMTQLKGLQTAYGVVDTNQGGLFDRLSTVGARLEQLVFGRGVETAIFGTATPTIYSSLVALGFLSFFLAFYRPTFLHLNKQSKFNLDLERRNNLSVLGAFVLTSLFFHIAFGVTIGKPLNIQHYIMVSPLSYFACAILFTSISYTNNTNPIKITLKSIAVIFAIFIFTSNIFSGQKISNRLATEGGNGLYSDAINKVGLYISTLPPDTVVLFPQWGYWMGVVTITGPVHSMFHAPNLGEMEARLKSDPALKDRNSLVLVLGRDYFRGNDIDIDLKEFLQRTDLTIEDIAIINGRNNIDKVKLVHLSTRKP